MCSECRGEQRRNCVRKEKEEKRERERDRQREKLKECESVYEREKQK